MQRSGQRTPLLLASNLSDRGTGSWLQTVTSEIKALKEARSGGTIEALARKAVWDHAARTPRRNCKGRARFFGCEQEFVGPIYALS